jgi:hypothetical protein
MNFRFGRNLIQPGRPGRWHWLITSDERCWCSRIPGADRSTCSLISRWNGRDSFTWPQAYRPRLAGCTNEVSFIRTSSRPIFWWTQQLVTSG